MVLKEDDVFCAREYFAALQKQKTSRVARRRLPSLSDAFVDDMFAATTRRFSKLVLTEIPPAADAPKR